MMLCPEETTMNMNHNASLKYHNLMISNKMPPKYFHSLGCMSTHHDFCICLP